MDATFNSKDIETVSRSDEAKKLLSTLRRDSGHELQLALKAAQSGNYEKAASILKPLLEQPSTEQLIQELNQKIGRS